METSIPKTYTAHTCLKCLRWSSHAFTVKLPQISNSNLFFQVLNTWTMKQVPFFVLKQTSCLKINYPKSLPKINCLKSDRQCWFILLLFFVYLKKKIYFLLWYSLLTHAFFWERSVNFKSNFSWNSIAQKINIILDKIRPYEARAELCQMFCLFFGKWFQEKCFWDLLTFSYDCSVRSVVSPDLLKKEMFRSMLWQI